MERGRGESERNRGRLTLLVVFGGKRKEGSAFKGVSSQWLGFRVDKVRSWLVEKIAIRIRLCLISNASTPWEKVCRQFTSCPALHLAHPTLILSVHGSLARAGKVKSQCPKVEKQEKPKTPKGRAKKRLLYNRRFVLFVFVPLFFWDRKNGQLTPKFSLLTHRFVNVTLAPGGKRKMSVRQKPTDQTGRPTDDALFGLVGSTGTSSPLESPVKPLSIPCRSPCVFFAIHFHLLVFPEISQGRTL